METSISGIPSVILNRHCDRVWVCVHGQHGCKEEAVRFAALAKDCAVIGFDLPGHGARGDDHELHIAEGMQSIDAILRYAFSRWDHVCVYARSMGAYLTLMQCADMPVERCLFQSPIADMEGLVRNMMGWFSVTEERLRAESRVVTPVDVLKWDAWEYIRTHPVTKWDIPTDILYGGKDGLQSEEGIRAFAKRFGCALTVCPECDHPFMSAHDLAVSDAWLRERL